MSEYSPAHARAFRKFYFGERARSLAEIYPRAKRARGKAGMTLALKASP
jgi:hypothetical protein